MAFGSMVTNLLQQAIGTNGYVIKADVSILLASSIESIQIQAAPADTPEPFTTSTSLDVLLSYLNNAGSPIAAFSSTDSECWIYLDTAEFPYTSTTRFALIGKRRPQNLASDYEYLDLPDKDLNLVIAYCLELAYSLKKNGVPKYVYDSIKKGEKDIRG